MPETDVISPRYDEKNEWTQPSNARHQRLASLPTGHTGEAATPLERNTATSTRPVEREPVLFTQAVPAVSTRVVGPREIVIGQEAAYRLTLRNDDRTDANGVVIEVDIPSSADVAASKASLGITQHLGEDGMEWQIQRLSAGETATLDLTLVPKSSAPLALGIALRIEPLVQQTTVTVQEPKLELALEGPDDVLYGESKIFRLRVSNPGTGPAEKVVLHLIPPGGGAEQQTSHALGHLPAGTTETFEVELTARDAGKLRVQSSATAAGGLLAECEKEVYVRRPILSMESQGLNETYAGTTANYILAVRNDGTADAEGVSVTVQLPRGAQLVDASEGHRENTAGSSVTWDIGTIAAGGDDTIEFQCQVSQPGNNEVIAVAQTADGGLFVKSSLTTRVIALADLKLEISDPTGPIAVGSDAVYQIRVQNRGSNTAKTIQVVALFSEGIDPIAVDGGHHTIRNGRVAFQSIDSLAPGRDVTLQIRAVASTPGTHIFRAEVLCSELETKLSSEETTRFFAADFGRGSRNSTAERPTDSTSR